EPCARAFPAARARRNAPVISDNAVVAATINWRAESTGNPLPLSRPATQLAENHGKSRSGMRISAALLPWNWKLAQTRARRLRVPPGAALGRRLRLFTPLLSPAAGRVLRDAAHRLLLPQRCRSSACRAAVAVQVQRGFSLYVREDENARDEDV